MNHQRPRRPVASPAGWGYHNAGSQLVLGRKAMATITSRQRVLAALNHEEADRVPIDFGGRHSVHVYAHRALLRHLGYEGGEEKIRTYMTYAAEPDPRLIARFASDAVAFGVGPQGDYQFQLDPASDSLSGRVRHGPPSPTRRALLRPLPLPAGAGHDGGGSGSLPLPRPQGSAPTGIDYRAPAGRARGGREGADAQLAQRRHLDDPLLSARLGTGNAGPGAATRG